MEKLLNDYKNKIFKFDVYPGVFVVHLDGNGVVEIESADEFTDIECSYILNNEHYAKMTRFQLETFLNVSKDKIERFDVSPNKFLIHLKENEMVQIKSVSEKMNVMYSHIINQVK